MTDTAVESTPKRKRGRPKGSGNQAKADSQKLALQKFLEYIAIRPEGFVSVYRLRPKCDNGRVGEDKIIEKLPPGEFSIDLMRTRHGWGVYQAFYNGLSRTDYRETLIDLTDDPVLWDEMMTPGKCKVNLRTVLEDEKNKGLIAAWKARGMWPDEAAQKEQEEMAEAATAMGMVGGIVNRVLESQQQLQMQLQAQQAQAQLPKQAGGGITAEEMHREIRLMELNLRNEALLKDIARLERDLADARREAADARREAAEERTKAAEERTKAAAAGAGAGPLAPLQEYWNQRMLAEAMKSTQAAEEPESVFGIIRDVGREAIPAIRTYLTQRQAAASTPAAAAAEPPKRYNPTAPPESADARDGRQISEMLALFNAGKSPAAAATKLVEIDNRPDLYDELKRHGGRALVEFLKIKAADLALFGPAAENALQSEAALVQWIDEALAFYEEDEEPTAAPTPPPAEPPPPPAAAAPPTQEPQTTTRASRRRQAQQEEKEEK